eukprot:5671938-Alexandrium_andersonii.AAC.1
MSSSIALIGVRGGDEAVQRQLEEQLKRAITLKDLFSAVKNSAAKRGSLGRPPKATPKPRR